VTPNLIEENATIGMMLAVLSPARVTEKACQPAWLRA
jgi:hypothetical protein